MASLKELRTRISSVKTTKQMTNAMKMVAAAKLRKAQQAILQVRPYANKIHDILETVVVATNGDIDNPLFDTRKEKKILLVVITSNRGLCGAFNSNVEKKTVETIENYVKNGISQNNIDLYCFGKRGAEALKRRNFNIIEKDFNVFDNLTYEKISEKSSQLAEKYAQGEYDKIEIIYNSFKNAATHILTKEQFLPVAMPKDLKLKGDFIFEPNLLGIIETLVPQALTMQLFKALLDSYAAEHGARMTAMHKATDNATELIYDLTLSYNKARQAAITKEILEIVSGAEALKG
jgi:F-type H+-transporting ATPase subunit gamma